VTVIDPISARSALPADPSALWQHNAVALRLTVNETVWSAQVILGGNAGGWGGAAVKRLGGGCHLVTTGRSQRVVYDRATALRRACRGRLGLNKSDPRGQDDHQHDGDWRPPGDRSP
jgi:hypothetical protein